MTDGIQSIEDLISASQGGMVDEDSVEGKFKKKAQTIKDKELERMTEGIASAQGLPYISLHGFPISPEALSLMPEKQAEDLQSICFFYDGTNIRIASLDPESRALKKAVNEIASRYYAEVKVYLVSKRSFKHAMALYKMLPNIRQFVDGVAIDAKLFQQFSKEITDYRVLNEKIQQVNVSEIITLILATAVKINASDVHIEAGENQIIIRYRIDGVLQEAANIDKSMLKKIISRLKLLARVKININDKPQDGRFTIFLDKEKIDCRVSFLPTAYGESVVTRLLKSSSIGLPFKELGLHEAAFNILKKEIKKPNGVILTTGPTGSGKTTTLYAVLNKLNSQESKIITLEDPIEYKLEGINQSQINNKKDYTFSRGLRSILRQDPDIVMVGEIRDLDTAEIAVQAGLTGHLVLSTLHTNDASGVIPRLTEMGVKPFLIVPALNCVIGQRLVRKLCPHCQEKHNLSEAESEKVKKILAIISPKSGVEIPKSLPAIYKAGKGCDKCHGIGYKGRIGIYEIFTMDNEIKELTVNGAPSFKILQQAIESGMITMLQDGILKVLDGKTSLEEVYRVIGKFDYVDAIYDIVISRVIGRGFKISQKTKKESAIIASDFLNIESEMKNISTNNLVDVILAMAIKMEASDIHIDPADTHIRLRFRIDGIMHDVASLSKDHYLPILSRIKITAGIATNIKKASYEGRFSIYFDGEKDKTDCRLSIISGGYGETIVVRLLVNQASALDVKTLGLRGHSAEVILRAVSGNKGIVITTGPTGSGKTTTLYSLLNYINKPDVKIITIEDPIEYHLDGIMQTQIDSEGGYTFASSLRSLMRQNPNVIMVGEIRDNETAKTAIEASLTGHLVLSTIHANSAAGSISRFMGLGITQQLLSSSLECAVGQRLVRKICPHCKIEDNIGVDKEAEVAKILSKISPASKEKIPKRLKFYKGSGCEKCNNLGYKGQIGVYEVIAITPDIQKIIQQKTFTEFDIIESAKKSGSLTMLEDGILKVLAGETTFEEVMRVAR